MVEFTGSADKGNKYVLELEGAKFMNGNCAGSRVNNDVSKGIDVPQAAGALTIRAAWSSSDRKVGFRAWMHVRRLIITLLRHSCVTPNR